MIKIKSPDALDKGRQIGISARHCAGGDWYWITIGVQKRRDLYIAHIDVVNEEKMAADELDVDLTVQFVSLAEAIEFLTEKLPSDINELILDVSKGQKFFNPEFLSS